MNACNSSLLCKSPKKSFQLYHFLVPFMGIYSYQFYGPTESLEQNVSPPKDLTAFTLIFQTLTNNKVVRPNQMACYGNEGEDCRLSVVINTNFTLGITIESTR